MQTGFGTAGFGDHVNHTARRAAAKLHRAAARQNLDTLNGGERNAGEPRTALLVLRQALAVDQHQSVLVARCAKATQVDLYIAVASRIARVNPGVSGQQIGDAVGARAFNIFGGNHPHPNRQFVNRLGESCGGNDYGR